MPPAAESVETMLASVALPRGIVVLLAAVAETGDDLRDATIIAPPRQFGFGFDEVRPLVLQEAALARLDLQVRYGATRRRCCGSS